MITTTIIISISIVITIVIGQRLRRHDRGPRVSRGERQDGRMGKTNKQKSNKQNNTQQHKTQKQHILISVQGTGI